MYGGKRLNYDQLRDKFKAVIKEVRLITNTGTTRKRITGAITKTAEQLKEEVQTLEVQYEEVTNKEECKQLRTEKSKRQKYIKTIELDYLPKLAHYEA